MNEPKASNPVLDQSFLKRLNEGKVEDKLSLDLPCETFKNVLSKEIKLKELLERLQNTRQEKVSIKEVILESELDFINSIKQLKSVFRDELKATIEKINDLYNNELIKLQQLYRSEVIGSKLLEMVKTVAGAGWYLLMKDTSVNLCKFYNPPFEVVTGISETMGIINEYEEPVCCLKAIYVNILHDKISYTTIHLSTEDHHPNCEQSQFGMACAGSLEGRVIPLDNTQALLQLLNEISSTYERIHLDSSYYTPSTSHTTRKDDKVWKTAM